MGVIGEFLRSIATDMGAVLEERIATQTYKEVYIKHPSGWIQRIDVVREQPVHFGTLQMIDGVRVDTLENIGSNKITAIFGRLEPKDYLDLYMIVNQSEWSFDTLFDLARKKDLGLNEFFFSFSLDSIEQINIWPKLHIELSIDEVKKYYHALAKTLIGRVKPEEK